MLINSISKCCKPKRFSENVSHSKSQVMQRKNEVGFKMSSEHREEITRYTSILKAYSDVNKSSKMNIYKRLPEIGTLAIGTSLALTQPGKFSAKAATGLGFLVATNLVAEVANKISKRNSKVDSDSDTKSQNLKRLVSISCIFGSSLVAASLVSKGVKNINPEGKIAKAIDFLKQESLKFADELNSTKVAKFIENKTNSFALKHPKLSNILSTFIPISIIGCVHASEKLLRNSLSNDIKNKANENYENYIQNISIQN